MAEPQAFQQNKAAFEVYVCKDTFKFNAAHFVAFKGYREKLHGHNYKVGVRLFGDRTIGSDGYVIDFGCIKDVCKKTCKQLNEHFLCPMHSDVLKITTDDTSVHIECEDGSVFMFPRHDCVLLPIVHATAEEMAIYLYAEIINALNAEYLIKRGLHTMEVTVAEAPGQEATFRLAIPENLSADFKLDVREFIAKGDIIPMPCPTEAKPKTCCPVCVQSQSNIAEGLEQLAKAYNDGRLPKDVTPSDLAQFLSNASK
jgi:6-pyruvoyl-tetrahydropterin synthase